MGDPGRPPALRHYNSSSVAELKYWLAYQEFTDAKEVAGAL